MIIDLLIKIIMPHLISNLVEKAYTPYTARLAPKNLWSKPQLGKSPELKKTKLSDLLSAFCHS
jgi:hypothetical protein